MQFLQWLLALKQVVVITPPGADGSVDAATLVATQLIADRPLNCRIDVFQVWWRSGSSRCGIWYRRLYPVAVKLSGLVLPGWSRLNSCSAAVLIRVFQQGPSESIVFADGSVDGGLAALDLLIEAEHGPDSSAFLVTTSLTSG